MYLCLDSQSVFLWGKEPANAAQIVATRLKGIRRIGLRLKSNSQLFGLRNIVTGDLERQIYAEKDGWGVSLDCQFVRVPDLLKPVGT